MLADRNQVTPFGTAPKLPQRMSNIDESSKNNKEEKGIRTPLDEESLLHIQDIQERGNEGAQRAKHSMQKTHNRTYEHDYTTSCS